jgi:hypothetical protein
LVWAKHLTDQTDSDEEEEGEGEEDEAITGGNEETTNAERGSSENNRELGERNEELAELGSEDKHTGVLLDLAERGQASAEEHEKGRVSQDNRDHGGLRENEESGVEGEG